MKGVLFSLCVYTLVSGPSSHAVASPVTKDTIEKILGTSFHVSSSFEFVGKVERNVTGAGYHRKMKTSVEGQVIGKIGVPLTTSSCRFLFIERVSKYMYFDLDELRMHEPFGGVTPKSMVQSIDVEKPSEVSREHILGLEAKQGVHILNNNVLQGAANTVYDVSVEFEVPFHLRYQAASWTRQFGKVPINMPVEAYLTCGDRNWPSNEENSWIKVGLNSEHTVAVLDVPVGNMSHQKYVGLLTLFMAMGGALYVYMKMR